MMLAAYAIAILGVGFLLVAHEAGHYFAARHFGMRVVRASLGFGPVVWRHRGKDGTVYQIGLIPFLAYVQIAGMNAYEDDGAERASYARAGLWARVVTMAAGSLANFAVASLLVFVGLLLGKHGALDAARLAVLLPPKLAHDDLVAIARWATGHESLALSGPVGLVRAAATQAATGPGVLLGFLAVVSAAMGTFNLLPFPFLDGGRLVFLAFEALARRKVAPRLEAWVHAAGLVVLMIFMVIVTYGDVVRT